MKRLRKTFNFISILLIPNWIRKILTSEVSIEKFNQELKMRASSKKISYSFMVVVLLVSSSVSYNFGRYKKNITLREEQVVLAEQKLSLSESKIAIEKEKLYLDLDERQNKLIEIENRINKLLNENDNNELKSELLKAQVEFTRAQNKYIQTKDKLGQLDVQSKFLYMAGKAGKMVAGGILLRYGLPLTWKLFLNQVNQINPEKNVAQELKDTQKNLIERRKNEQFLEKKNCSHEKRKELLETVG